jgi:hypothetical protein
VPVGCRVLSLKGTPGGSDGGPSGAVEGIKVGDLLNGERPLDLPAGLHLSLRHSETTRELVLAGGGRFVVCPGGDETVLLTRGSVSTTAGPGAHAGAEVHVGTPFGVVHFGDAALKVTVTRAALELRVTVGTASVSAGGAADSASPPKQVSGPAGRLKLLTSADPDALVKACEATLGALAAPRPSASAPEARALGDWAVEKLRARQESRYACMRAQAAAAGRGGPEGDRALELLTAKIGAAGRRPTPSAGPGKAEFR